MPKYGDRRPMLRNPKDQLKTGAYHAMLKQLVLKRDDLFKERTMQRFTYSVALAVDKAGGYVVTCRDVPKAITQRARASTTP